jgi:hypothetical protein
MTADKGVPIDPGFMGWDSGLSFVHAIKIIENTSRR